MLKSPKVEYTAFFRAHNMHCSFLFNGFRYQKTLNKGDPQLMSYMGSPGPALQEGDNTIGIEAYQLEKLLGPEQTPHKPFCEMRLMAEVQNTFGESESKIVSEIRITYDDEGNFTAQESEAFPEPSVTDAPRLTIQKTKRFDGAQLNDVLVTRTLKVNHTHKYFSWPNATPFADTPANRELLWKKYEEFRKAFANKDEATLRKLFEPGASEADNYRGAGYFESLLVHYRAAWDAEDFEVLPVKREDYDLQLAANGKIFRLVSNQKGMTDSSPIEYRKDQEIRVFIPNFTYINGKIVVAFI